MHVHDVLVCIAHTCGSVVTMTMLTSLPEAMRWLLYHTPAVNTSLQGGGKQTLELTNTHLQNYDTSVYTCTYMYMKGRVHVHVRTGAPSHILTSSLPADISLHSQDLNTQTPTCSFTFSPPSPLTSAATPPIPSHPSLTYSATPSSPPQPLGSGMSQSGVHC